VFERDKPRSRSLSNPARDAISGLGPTDANCHQRFGIIVKPAGVAENRKAMHDIGVPVFGIDKKSDAVERMLAEPKVFDELMDLLGEPFCPVDDDWPNRFVLGHELDRGIDCRTQNRRQVHANQTSARRGSAVIRLCTCFCRQLSA
jgi:hypothetical protein